MDKKDLPDNEFTPSEDELLEKEMNESFDDVNDKIKSLLPYLNHMPLLDFVHKGCRKTSA